MGYQTTFTGSITVTPPLNETEVNYLTEFSRSRRMKRKKGPYFAVSGNNYGQEHASDIIDYNTPPKNQPGLWCKWEPSEDGKTIQWSGMEKFYDGAEWMAYIIHHFIKEKAYATVFKPKQFKEFTAHLTNGTIFAKGEDSNDIWKIVVKNNTVYTSRGKYIYPFKENEMDSGEYYDKISNHDIDFNEVSWGKLEKVAPPISAEELVQYEKKIIKNSIKITTKPQKLVRL